MKTLRYILLLFPFFSFPAFAQDTASADSLNNNPKVEYRFALGIQLGTDIGGAIPFPLSNVPSPFNPYPQLYPSLGAKLTFPVTRRWGIGAELTYKKVAIDADARIENQRFNDTKNDVIARFTGSAEMTMSFTMLEVPVYAKYTFKNQKDRLLFGGYFAYILKGKFDNSVKKGFMMTDEGVYNGAIESDPLDISFSDILDSWDAGLLLGYERRLFSRVEIGLRVSCGLKDIFKPDNQYFDYKMLHMRGTVAISYNLFNLRPPKLNPFRHRQG